MFSFILDFLFPPRCPICQSYIEKRDSWCHACVERTLCVHRLPLSTEMLQLMPDGVWAMGVYEGGLRDELRGLKYNGRRASLLGLHHFITCGLTKLLATDLAEENLAEVHSSASASAGKAARLGGAALSDYIAVPVPLHKKRLAKRGFNQTELLFKQPLAQHGIKLKNYLERIKFTQPQFELDAQERAKNLQHAFAVSSSDNVAGKNILLLDDIMTTGATLYECATVLKNAGAKNILGCVVASGRK